MKFKPEESWGRVIQSAAGSRPAKLKDEISLPFPDKILTLPLRFPVLPENARALLRKKKDKLCDWYALIRISRGKTNANFPSAPVTAETFFAFSSTVTPSSGAPPFLVTVPEIWSAPATRV